MMMVKCQVTTKQDLKQGDDEEKPWKSSDDLRNFELGRDKAKNPEQGITKTKLKWEDHEGKLWSQIFFNKLIERDNEEKIIIQIR